MDWLGTLRTITDFHESLDELKMNQLANTQALKKLQSVLDYVVRKIDELVKIIDVDTVASCPPLISPGPISRHGSSVSPPCE